MLEKKIYQDYQQALKAKDKPKSLFLSFLRAELKNKAIELKKDSLEDAEALIVLKKEKKRLEDTRESLVNCPRPQLLKDLELELSLLSSYLPAEMADEELLKIIKEVIKQEAASSLKDMGRVMKQVLQAAAGRADPKKASGLVQKELSGA